MNSQYRSILIASLIFVGLAGFHAQAEDIQPAKLELMQGTAYSGKILTVDGKNVVLENKYGERSEVSLKDVVDLSWASVENQTVPEGHSEFILTDGSRLWVSEFSIESTNVTLSSANFGNINLSQKLLRSIRFSSDAEAQAAWSDFQTTNPTSDKILVFKNKTLSAYDFIVGPTTHESTSGNLLGKQVDKLPTKNLYGIYFGTNKTERSQVLGTLALKNGELLKISDFSLNDGSVELILLNGEKLRTGVEAIASLDLGSGKFASLKDVPFSAEYKKTNKLASDASAKRLQSIRFDEVPRPRTKDGAFLLDGKSYSKGIWMHSGTTAVFKLNKGFRKFEGSIGIDQNPNGDKVKPHVHVIITTDEKVVFDKIVEWGKPSESLSINVENVKDLKFEVQSGNENNFAGAAEHLAIVNARLIRNN